MYSFALFGWFFYFFILFAGIGFLIFLIIFMNRYISLKKEHNQLFREYIRVIKEKKHMEA